MLNELAKEIHEIAVAHGWWESDRPFPEIVALCHSELSEALEAFRNGEAHVYYDCEFDGNVCPMCRENADEPFDACKIWDEQERTCEKGYLGEKPEGIAIEMADCLIRILDWCAREAVDIDAIVQRKITYNRTRPYRHGGKKA